MKDNKNKEGVMLTDLSLLKYCGEGVKIFPLAKIVKPEGRRNRRWLSN